MEWCMIADLNIHRALRNKTSREMSGFALLNDSCMSPMEARQLKADIKRWKVDSNVKLHLSMKNPHFQAGSMLRGNVQVETRSSAIQLKGVRITLMGSEETVGRFLPNRKAFMLQQGAVLEHDDVINSNFKHGAITPITTFDFELELSKDLPSTFLHPWAALRYVLFCEATFCHLRNPGKPITTCAQREVLILETIAPATLAPWLTTCILGELNYQPSLFGLGTDGLIQVVVKLAKKAWLAGSPLVVGFVGTNMSGKRISSIRLRLCRRVMIFDESHSLAPIHQTRSTVSHATFKDQATLQGFEHSDFDLSLLLEIPPHYRTIQNAHSLSVTYSLRVSLSTRFGYCCLPILTNLLAPP
ncbi:hypothetical protein DSO57_1037961 [Entomophthora muscae]|uniref:Uncharacterized protein n=1 Tax=Entomophthora muscae TaxID=34485 RepID=A0ACC2UJ92_9FUNG|nr:hypothetical protein DSO57_1037961 [Entomophthora muscae]